VLQNPDEDLDYKQLLQNPNITINDVLQTLDLPWSYEYLSEI